MRRERAPEDFRLGSRALGVPERGSDEQQVVDDVCQTPQEARIPLIHGLRYVNNSETSCSRLASLRPVYAATPGHLTQS